MTNVTKEDRRRREALRKRRTASFAKALVIAMFAALAAVVGYLLVADG